MAIREYFTKNGLEVVFFYPAPRAAKVTFRYGPTAYVAIKTVGEMLQEMVVKDLEGRAFRQGGDEFVILLKQDLVETFLTVVSSLGNILFSHKEKELRTAMSLGLAFSDGKTSFSDLLERAEIACQYAKAKGDGACIEWTRELLVNPVVRIGAKCQKCGAKISCNLPKQNAPTELKVCPCCGESLHTP
jgi:GGDEF domain-containing protein